MTLILLEALLALAILAAIVWWTMFAGRKKGELPAQTARKLSSERENQAEHVKSNRNTSENVE